MPLRFSCTSFSFPTLGLHSVAAVVGALGFRNIDVCLVEADRAVDIRWVEAEPLSAADRVRELMTRFNLQVLDVFTILNRDRDDRPISHPDPRIREHNQKRFEAVAEFAFHVGAAGITLLPGQIQPQIRDGGRSLSVEALSDFARITTDQGIRLSIEPHIGSIAETPAGAHSLVRDVPGLSLTLDYSHFVGIGIDQREVDPLIGSAGHIQVRQAAPGRIQSGSKLGVIRFGSILEHLVASDYVGGITLEYVWSPWRELDRVDVVSETVLLAAQLSERFKGLGQSVDWESPGYGTP